MNFLFIDIDVCDFRAHVTKRACFWLGRIKCPNCNVTHVHSELEKLTHFTTFIYMVSQHHALDVCT